LAWKVQSPPPFEGYRFKQIFVYPHHDKPRWGAEYHHYIRLYNKQAMRFRDSLTHDAVEPGAQAIGTFDGDCLHFSYRSLAHLAEKLDRYTDLQAKEIKKPLWRLYPRLPFEYILLFIRYYFVRRHFTGGIYGLRVAHTIARGRAARIGKFIRAHKRPKRLENGKSSSDP